MDEVFIVDVITHLNLQSKTMTELLQKTSLEELNRKVGERWSAGQIVEHIRITNSLYFPIFEKKIQDQKPLSFWEKIPLLSKLWGNLIKQSVSLKKGKISKTVPIFEPQKKTVDSELLKDYQEHKRKLVDFIEKMKEFDLDMVQITSPAAAMITYSLRDCLEMIWTHEEKHIDQLKKLLRGI